MFFSYPMGRNTLEDAVDKINIRERIEFERYCSDYKIWEMLRSAYDDSVRIETFWGEIDRDAFIERTKNTPLPAKNKVFDTIVWKKGDRAIAECLAMYEIRCPLDGDTVDLSAHVRFHYRVQCINETWKIVFVTPIFEKDTLFSCYTDGTFRVSAETLKQFRASYCNLMYLATRYGETANDQMIGEDHPEMVQKLYEESDRWVEMKI